MLTNVRTEEYCISDLSGFWVLIMAAARYLFLAATIMVMCSLASARPLCREDSGCGSLPTGVRDSNHLCPSSVQLQETGNCTFPVPRSNGVRNSCYIHETIKATEKYCLRMDDPQNVICTENKTTTGDESLKLIRCWCHFNEANLDTPRYCYFYTY